MHEGFGLPLEYQSQLEALASRRKLAQALQAQAAAPVQVPQYGRMASKLSPLAPLGQALAMYLNQKNVDAADTERTRLLAQNEREGQEEMSRLTGMEDLKAQIAAASVSNRPGIRLWGAGRQKTYDEQQKAAQAARDARLLAAGQGAFKGDDYRGGMRILQSEQIPTDYSLPPIPAARIEPVPGGPPGQVMAVETNSRGEERINFNALPSQVKVNQGGVTLPGQNEGFQAWAKAAVADNQKMGEGARGAVEFVQTLDQMGALDERGLVAGPLANPLLFVTGLAKQAGLPVDADKLANSASYNALAQQAVQNLVAQLGGAKGFTERESLLIQQSLPQLQQSVEARKQLSTILRQAAVRRIEEYKESTRNLQRSLQERDISHYSFGSVQVPGVPPVAPVAPAGAAPTTMPLTPEEQRELERLRRGR